MRLRVELRSEFLDIALNLFCSVVSTDNAFLASRTHTEVVFIFLDDELKQDIRSWQSDALSCGLLTGAYCNYAE